MATGAHGELAQPPGSRGAGKPLPAPARRAGWSPGSCRQRCCGAPTTSACRSGIHTCSLARPCVCTRCTCAPTCALMCAPTHALQSDPCQVCKGSAGQDPRMRFGLACAIAWPSWEHGLVAASPCLWGPGGTTRPCWGAGVLGAVWLGGWWWGSLSWGAEQPPLIYWDGEKRKPPKPKQKTKEKSQPHEREDRGGLLGAACHLARCQPGDAPEQTCQAVIADRLISRDETVIFNSR